MKKKELRREDVIDALREIAFSRPNPAIRLAFLQTPSPETIRRLNLSSVAEFRRSSAGTVEIKFVDRVKALEALERLLSGAGESGAAESLLRALQEAGEETP